MAIKTEPVHAGEFLISEAPGTRSREEGVVSSGQTLVAGELVEDAAGEYITYAGVNPCVGIVWDDVDASTADQVATIIVRDAEIDSSICTGVDAGGLTDLAALNVHDRS